VEDWLAAEFDGSVKFASVPLSGMVRLVLAGAYAGMKRPCMQRGSVSKALRLLYLCVGKEVMTSLTLWVTAGAMMVMALVTMMILAVKEAGLFVLIFFFGKQCQML
jgi:hypothetical protein